MEKPVNKYTVIYPRNAGGGFTLTVSDRIETDDLHAYLEKNYRTDIWFVFEGWPERAPGWER